VKSNLILLLVAAVTVAFGIVSFDTCANSTQYIVVGAAQATPYATESPEPDPIILAAGDIASCALTTDETTAQLLDKLDGTILLLGDIAYERGTTAEFRNCYDPTWGRHKDRTYPAPGNHDYVSVLPYYDYFGKRAGPVREGYYSFDLGAWHIIALNSNIDARKGSAQEKWLRADLETNKATCTLAFWHHPLYSSGQHGNDMRMRDVWRTLLEYGVSVVLNGHDHNYERFAPQDADGQANRERGIREFVVGTGGASLRKFAMIRPNSEVRDSQTWGVLKMTLRATSYDWQFIPIDGQTFTDNGSAACVSR